MQSSRLTPARFRRAFFIFGCLVASAGWCAAPRGHSAPPLIQLGKADPVEAQAAIEQVRRQGIAGNYFLEFNLRVMPRRGEERNIPGRLWGSRNAQGALSRVAVTLTEGGAGPVERRLLIQSGRESAVWRWDTGGNVEQLGPASPFEPVVPSTQLTAFDLQMPFVYWEDFDYQGLSRFKGRPAHIMIMRPPASFSSKYPEISGVRIYLDTQFNALVQTELLGARNAVLKTFSLVDLKRIGEQWIPKTFDVRDDRTRDKTRLEVTAAGLNLDFSQTLFEPAQLAEDVRAPDESQLTRIAP